MSDIKANRVNELDEILPVHVMRLANLSTGLSSTAWNKISNDILEAATLLRALDEARAKVRRLESDQYRPIESAPKGNGDQFESVTDPADIDRAAEALAAFREAGGLPWDQKMEIARENWRKAVRVVIEALERKS